MIPCTAVHSVRGTVFSDRPSPTPHSGGDEGPRPPLRMWVRRGCLGGRTPAFSHSAERGQDSAVSCYQSEVWLETCHVPQGS